MIRNSDVAVSVEMAPSMVEIDYHSDLLQKHAFNYFDPSHKRKAFATPLLCGAVLGCVSGALWLRMKHRGVELTSLRGRAFPTHATSEHGYGVLDAVAIELEVSCPPEYVAVLEEEKQRILKHGCPAVGSVQKPIAVDIHIALE